jgi:hypothetical protein
MKLEREVSKEMHELIQAVVKIIEASKVAMKDGFQAGSDVPAVVMASMPAMMQAIGGIDKLPEEFKEEMLPKAIMALCIGSGDIAEAILKK